ncbi:hypothetical protein CA54_55780 [Symmachiella macrocystis]|uniref:Uncharacterized protein n=1 Tax=Symmachiella macrocystis TaxID=2527985 RepID=A0A5C6B4T3_9PLAN|nr:MafI family immunity protein [Symmachiella macrocystis]TWU07173.1 hypothetical protein CA54_55780 [Symmachiella macrocystis]
MNSLVDESITAVANEVQHQLNKLFATTGTPEAESTLDQAGLKDGAMIVRDYVDHGEQGIAFEHLIYMITEPNIEITAQAYRQLVEAGMILGFSPATWAKVRYNLSG